MRHTWRTILCAMMAVYLSAVPAWADLIDEPDITRPGPAMAAALAVALILIAAAVLVWTIIRKRGKK